MSRICIVSNNQIEAKKIQDSLNVLSLDAHQRLQFEHIRPSQIGTHLHPSIDIMVYNHPHQLDMNLKQQVISWRKHGFFGSSIVLTKVTDQDLLTKLNGINNFVVIEKPFDEKDLQGVTQKFLNTITVNQRRFRRFNADQVINLESYKTDFKSESKVSNISLGGLCIEGDWGQLSQGDLLKVQFPLDQLHREHTMNVKVVWVRKSGVCSAGVEFVKNEELYSELLNSMA